MCGHEIRTRTRKTQSEHVVDTNMRGYNKREKEEKQGDKRIMI